MAEPEGRSWMSFATLAVVSVVAVLGPLLGVSWRWPLPGVVGGLVARVAPGPTRTGRLPPRNPTFTFLANVGFALVMFVAGSHVPVRAPRLRAALRVGVVRAVGAGVLSVLLAFVVARLFGTSHALLYAVLMTSSSAALIL